MINWISSLGRYIIGWIIQIGKAVYLNYQILISLFKAHFPWSQLWTQIYVIGFQSILLIGFSAFFMGMVFAFASGVNLENQFKGIGDYLGTLLANTFLTEVGPVVTGLLLVGRTTSSITAELGSMKVSQQIDALVTMGISPHQYLLLPRVLGAVIAMPILVHIADLLGILGGYVIAYFYLNQTAYVYLSAVQEGFTLALLIPGIKKSLIFGYIIAFTGIFSGFLLEGGSLEVGKKTTRAVVIGSISIVIMDYIITAYL